MSDPVSTQVIRVIKPGHEEAFETRVREFYAQAQPIPGQLAVHVIKPVPGSGSREWGFLRTFASPQARDDFFASDVFREYDASVAEHTEGDTRWSDLCGLETWFTAPGHRAVIPPPRWKMAMVTFLGVYLTSNVMSRVLGPLVHGLPQLATSAVIVAGTVLCLTWLVMPALASLFRPWLQAGNSSPMERKAGV